MNIFSKLFSSNASINQINKNSNTQNYFEGQKFYQTGKKLFSEAITDKSLSSERKKQKKIAALEFLDNSIEVGYDNVDAFLYRGMCLRDLNYDIDALEDFNKCIDIDPKKASYYYDRALTKRFIYDFAGSLIDFEKAIELSKLDNDDTRYWNNFAKESGFKSATAKYELDVNFLQMDIDIMSEQVRKSLYEKALNERKRGFY